MEHPEKWIRQTQIGVSASGARAGGGAGKELATVVVAAVDSHASGIASANYVCDGIDDHVEINQALDDALYALDGFTERGGRVVLLEGTYNIAALVNIFAGSEGGVVLQGQGPATKLVVAPSFSGTSIAVSITNRGVLRDVQIDANDMAVTAVVIATGGAIERVDFANASVAEAISVTTGFVDEPAIISRCRVDAPGCDFPIVDCQYPAIVEDCIIDGGPVAGHSGVGIRLANSWCAAVGNVVRNCGYAGITTSSATDTVPAVIQGNIVAGCGGGFGDSGEGGISLDGFAVVTGNVVVGFDGNNDPTDSHGISIQARCVVAKNVVYWVGRHGILAQSDDCLIRGNMIGDPSQSSDVVYSGIFVAGGARNNIQANMVRRQSDTAPAMRYGILVNAGNDNLVTNNDLRNSGVTDSFHDFGTGTITAAGNRL